ncbi:FkbM family methyltransferase [Haliea sp. E17]|uniref:FkbM family methyltransferase n=1 Tax=Haliea sp. E17 TaxID=3401576 RepID=UPI003AAC581B
MLIPNLDVVAKFLLRLIKAPPAKRQELIDSIEPLLRLSSSTTGSPRVLTKIAELACTGDSRIWRRTEAAINSTNCAPSTSIHLIHKNLVELGYGNDVPQLCYSQEGEELILNRIFTKASGFYVDVGAHSPVRFSNTHLLYRRGWRGINIDPTPGLERAFLVARPEDKFYPCGVSNSPGELTLYMFKEGAYNTFDQQEKVRLEKAKNIRCEEEVTVPVRTLNSILEAESVENIDLLSIDVEGFELAVLEGLDLERYQPAVMIVEIKRDLYSDIVEHELYQYLVRHGYTMYSILYNSVIFTRR